MTNAELLAKIKAEIERRLQRENEILWNAKKRGTYPSPSCEYNLLTLTSLRDFIDTLSEEPDKVLEGEVILNGHGLLVDVTKWGDGHKLKVIIKEN